MCEFEEKGIMMNDSLSNFTNICIRKNFRFIFIKIHEHDSEKSCS